MRFLDRVRERRERKRLAEAARDRRRLDFEARARPKGGNVTRAEVRRRRARNKRARVSRKANRP